MSADRPTGSCLCGAVRFRLSEPPRELLHCHCRMCQKAHGAAYATFVRVPHEHFSVDEGAENLVTHRSSSEARRTFCGVCGSALQFIRDESSEFGLAASALDDDVFPETVRAFWADAPVPWH